MKFSQKHAFLPIKGEQNIQPTGLFRTTPLFGPLEYISKKTWIILYSDLVPFFQTQSTYVSLGLGARKAYLLMVLSLAQLAHVGSKYTYAQWIEIVSEGAFIF